MLLVGEGEEIGCERVVLGFVARVGVGVSRVGEDMEV